MHGGHQEQTGGIGQNEVAANFERLDWGPIPNYLHDRGTDLILQVRDERNIDLGLLVGAQVKAGSSWFDRPERGTDGELLGWWFRDSDRAHIDKWLAYSVPHLIALHNVDTKVSYWEHVTDENVVPTGSGARILVPKANVVGPICRESLLEVAGARREGIAWEGSVWLAGTAIHARDRLRHALIVPRLVAPHPNAQTTEPPSAEQAIAMLMQARLAELDRLPAAHPDVPSLDTAFKSSDWTWRFASALFARATTSDLDPLLAAVADARSPHTRAAGTVAAASALIEEGRLEEALVLLDAAIERADICAVDHAWLLAQRARARAEIGQLAEAQDDALKAQGIRLVAADDATASAVAASGAILVFNTSAWSYKDIEATITSADTAASWWRAQTTSRGLRAVTDRSFTGWARDTAVTFGLSFRTSRG